MNETIVPSVAERIKALPHDVVVSELIVAMCSLEAIGASDETCDSTAGCSHCFAHTQYRLMMNRLLSINDENLHSVAL